MTTTTERPARIWLTITNSRKGLTRSRDYPTVKEAMEAAIEAAADEDVVATIEHGVEVWIIQAPIEGYCQPGPQQ